MGQEEGEIRDSRVGLFCTEVELGPGWAALPHPLAPLLPAGSGEK